MGFANAEKREIAAGQDIGEISSAGPYRPLPRRLGRKANVTRISNGDPVRLCTATGNRGGGRNRRGGAVGSEIKDRPVPGVGSYTLHCVLYSCRLPANGAAVGRDRKRIRRWAVNYSTAPGKQTETGAGTNRVVGRWINPISESDGDKRLRTFRRCVTVFC